MDTAGNFDFVITSLQGINYAAGSNTVNLAYEFSRKHRVLYVNYPADRLTLIRNRKDPNVIKRLNVIRGKEESLVKVQDNLWSLYPKTILESVSQIGNNSLFDFLNKVNNKRFAKAIRKATETLGFKKFVIFTDSDMFRSFYLKDLLRPEKFIYYSRDNMIAVDWWKKQGVRIEAALIKKADLAVANSVYLANYCRQFNQNSHYVGQGCDVTAFNSKLITGPPPEDILDIKKPIIGYIGVLFKLRLDIEAIRFVASQRPAWSIVLIGPEDEAFKNSDLHVLPNVHFLGSKPPAALPSYLACFDVAINPQKLNEVTIGNYPRKIDEYLAMGKPTVATLTEAMSVFKDYVYLAETKEDYLRLIGLALEENTPDKCLAREEFARGHTWEANANEIYKAIGTMKKKEEPVTQPAGRIGSLVNRIKSNPKHKLFVIHLITRKNQGRPKFWVKWLLNPFRHKVSRGATICGTVRRDLFPWNDFVLGKASTIEDYATVNNGAGPLYIGERTRVGLNCTVIGPVTLGNDVMLAQNIVLSGLNHTYSDISVPISAQKQSTSMIRVEDEAWIGANCVIVAGVTIGKHSVVAAGSVVTKDVPPYSVVAGNPAKLIKAYNPETQQWERKI